MVDRWLAGGELPIRQIARVMNVCGTWCGRRGGLDGPLRTERRSKGSADEERAVHRSCCGDLDDAGGDRRIGGVLGPGVRTKVAGLWLAALPLDPASRTSDCGRGSWRRATYWRSPADHAAGRARAGADGEAAAGADDGCWSSAVGVGAAGALAAGRRPVRGVVGRDRGAGRGAADAGVGRGRRDRPLARPSQRADCGVPGVPGHAGRQRVCLPAPGPRRRRAWSNGSMTTWSDRSCPGGSSRPPPISTLSWPGGSRS